MHLPHLRQHRSCPLLCNGSHRPESSCPGLQQMVVYASRMEGITVQHNITIMKWGCISQYNIKYLRFPHPPVNRSLSIIIYNMNQGFNRGIYIIVFNICPISGERDCYLTQNPDGRKKNMEKDPGVCHLSCESLSYPLVNLFTYKCMYIYIYIYVYSYK